tara:strand:- start:77 stop:1945 length:1869 start_codon:yes stop_codon:yes gene_type:complete
MTLKESQKKAIESIHISLNKFRGRADIGRDARNIIIIMLVYAKYIPSSYEKIIGFFDVIQSLEPISRFDLIMKELVSITGLELEYLFDAGDILKGKGNTDPHTLMRTIDNLRADLLPAAKLIAKGNEDDIEKIISYLKEFEDGSFHEISIGVNKAVLDISGKLLDEASKNEDLNCFFPMGTGTAYYFAKKRNVFFYERNPFNSVLNKALLSLYGKPYKFYENYKETEVSFSAPPLGLKVRDGFFYIENFLPFNEDDESKLIKDLHSKFIYLSHLNTKNTTIAITNQGTLWTKNNGINYFRKLIIENNWLESVIKLPSNIMSHTAIPMALLILKKHRATKDKIQFIDFSDCKKDDSAKRGSLVIPDEEINSLIKLYKNKKASSISISVTTDQIRVNDYELNSSRYIISEEDKKFFEILKSRDSLPLDSLVNFVRSIPIPSIKDNDSSYAGEINEVILSDINQVGEITSTTKKTKVSKEFLSKSNIPFVKKGDLIISIKGSLGKIGTIASDLPNTIPGTSLCILRPREKSVINPEYILQYLRSEIGQKMFFNYGRGDFIAFLSINDLKNLNIPIPSLEEQKIAKKILKRSRDLVDSIQKMQEELDACTNSGWLQADKKIKDNSS